MLNSNNTKRKKFLIQKLCLFLMVMCIHLSSVPVYASDGWVEKNSIVYGGSTTSDTSSVHDDEVKPGYLEEIFGELVAGLANLLNGLMTNGDVNISLDGVVLGRMAENTDVAYAQFDLSTGNPWGVIGAVCYQFFRGIIYPCFVFVFLWQIITRFHKRSVAKDRAEFKEYCVNIAIFFIAMSIFPYVVDWCLYARDVLMYKGLSLIGDGIGSSGGTNAGVSVVQAFADSYAADKNFVTSLLYLASSCAGIFFFIDYIATALIQTGFYAGAGWVFLTSVKDKRKLATWAGTFFPNLLIPLIDAILLLVPTGIYAVYITNVGWSDSVSLAIRMIQLVCIWSIIPTRNAILKGICGYVGSPAPKSGVAGLAALAGMAMRGAGNGIRGMSGGISSRSENFREDTSAFAAKAAETHRQEAALFDIANQKTREGMPDVNDLLADEPVGTIVSGFDMDSNSEEYGRFNEQSGVLGSVEEGIGSALSGDELSMSEFEPRTSLASDDASLVLEADDVTNRSMLSITGESISSGMTSSPNDDTKVPETDDVTNRKMSSITEEGIGAGMTLSPNDDTKVSDVADITRRSIPSDSNMEGMDSAVDVKSKDSYSNVPNMGSDFAKSLKDGSNPYDFDRYANLNARDALENKVSTNTSQIESYRAKMASNKDEMALIASNPNTTDADRARSEALRAENKSYQNSISNLEKNNASLRSGIKNCTAREQQYATNYADAGMSGRTYANAKSFEIDKTVQQNKEKLANFKNYNSSRFDSVLTPAQRAELARKDAVWGGVTRVASTTVKAGARVAAGAAVGSLAASATAFGGSSAMAAGAMAGARVGSGSVDRVERTLKNAPGVAREMAITFSNAPAATKDIVREASNRVANAHKAVSEASSKLGDVTTSSTTKTQGAAHMTDADMLKEVNKFAEMNNDEFKNLNR